MENRTHILPWPPLLVFFSAIAFGHSQASDSKSYIVYMGDPLKGELSSSTLHTSMLEQVLGREITETTLQRSYGKSFNGFVAQLTDHEMQRVSEMEGVVSVFPNEKNQLDTTRSWDFIGFPQKVKRATTETDIIIGVLDSGIWPESDSFKDDGFGPPPAKWKGTCQTSANFTCNNKIVGARSYRSSGFSNHTDESEISPRDTDGHGTHVASIAAGGVVTETSMNGLGMGTARGGVPGARIAVYKICWSDGCFAADILAAFDDAISDGVDIISISVGARGVLPRNFFNDSYAIGFFHAMKNGILTSTSAGNSGPDLGSTTKVAPWFLSVAASTTDRQFTTKVQLGNNKIYEGVSINTFEPRSTYPMIYAGDAPNITANITGSSSRLCSRGSLDADLVRGKIVLCDTLSNARTPFLAGAAGVVIRNNDFVNFANSYPLPAAFVFPDEGTDIFNYVNTSRNPTATIYKSNGVKSNLAPYIASFSSRGCPNLIAKDIMKPDLAAPGAEILAAWSPVGPPTTVAEDGRSVRYNIISGTSMACPHASGVAAYIKSFHPSWSPASIKSAMMTTALPMSIETSPEAEFAYGAGHINPLKALNPGLVYDAEEIDYVKFLCGQGYSTKSLRLVTGDRSNCSDVVTETVWDLNLPSFTLSAIPFRPFKQTFNRVVTNVGSDSSTYKATVIDTSSALKIEVEPRTLTFKSVGEKLSFSVKVEGAIGRTTVSASLVWDDGTHQVRSPIVVYA